MAAPPPYTTEKHPSPNHGLHISLLPRDDDEDTSPHTPLLQHTPFTSTHPRHPPSPAHRRHWPWILHALLTTLSLTILLATLLSPRLPSTAACLPLTSSYSPAFPAIHYQTLKLDPGSNISASPYVGPTLAADLHWGRVNFGDQMISPRELDLLHKPRDNSLKVTDPKTGEVGYRVGLEVFHQLHCLNMVRKATYPGYEDAYTGGDFGVPRAQLRGHLDHCIEILRMTLECHADVGLITFSEVEGKGWQPDFAQWRVCRDYEKVRDWAVERVVATDVV